MQFGALTFLVLLPLAAAIPVLLGKDDKVVRWLALVMTAAEFLVVVFLCGILTRLGAPEGRWLLYSDLPWISRYGVRFSLGVDGISLLLVLLATFLFMMAVLVSWKSVREKVALFYAVLLVMETGVIGVFFATDLFLFYLFWEVMLIPMFFLIGVWGHGRRIYSAVKFFIYTVTGSLFMLFAIIGVYVLHGRQTGVYTFALDALLNTAVDPATSTWLFGAFMLAFAVKVPVFPLHSWLPDAHTDAPTAGSVILAGLLLKTGAYGMIRFAFPLFPHAAKVFLPVMFSLGVVGIFYASWIAYAQTDMKRLVAYSSISHLGLVVLGIAAWNDVSLAGSTLQMVNHGITTGALFIMVGMLDERVHSRDIDAFGGLWSKAPLLSAFLLLFILSSLGLPGLNNFSGEFLIIVGLFRGHPAIAGAAFAGIVFTLIYMLRLAQKLLFGPSSIPGEFSDLSPRELLILVPLAALVVVIGVYPAVLLRPLDAPIRGLVAAYSITAGGPVGVGGFAP